MVAQDPATRGKCVVRAIGPQDHEAARIHGPSGNPAVEYGQRRPAMFVWHRFYMRKQAILTGWLCTGYPKLGLGSDTGLGREHECRTRVPSPWEADECDRVSQTGRCGRTRSYHVSQKTGEGKLCCAACRMWRYQGSGQSHVAWSSSLNHSALHTWQQGANEKTPRIWCIALHCVIDRPRASPETWRKRLPDAPLRVSLRHGRTHP